MYDRDFSIVCKCIIDSNDKAHLLVIAASRRVASRRVVVDDVMMTMMRYGRYEWRSGGWMMNDE